MTTKKTNEKVFIAGGAGFIGSYLTRDLLKAGARVTIADLVPPEDAQGADFIKVDIMDRQALTTAMKGHTVVCNLAAAHRDNIKPISLYHRINVEGAENICDAASANHICRIVFASSVAVYGTQSAPPNEDSPHLATHPYGQTKSLAEKIYKSWEKSHEDRILAIIRPTVVFGAKNRGNVYTLIDQIARNRFIMIGDGFNRKSMAYVENVSAYFAHVLLSASKTSLTVNYIDKPDLDMNSLVSLLSSHLGKPSPKIRLPFVVGMVAGSGFDMLAHVSGKTLPISRLRVEKFCAETIFETKIHNQEDFKAPFTLADGLARTLAHEFGIKPPIQAAAAE